ncbi:MAG: hypothetical protein LBG90_08265 [Spirochaetaceae bacterium]|jgi:hypothetical protein|nr:hypothetical protein [Spirochaetaceae bacterium]
MKPLLIVLSGGPSGWAPIGPNGETLLEYGVYDALRAGFERIVFIVPRDEEEHFREGVLNRMKDLKYELVLQDEDAQIPPDIAEKAREAGRTKPWGEVHALLCGAALITVPAFAVISANCFYGREAFETMWSYLGSPSITQQKLPTVKQGFIVLYPLEKIFPKKVSARDASDDPPQAPNTPSSAVILGICGVKDSYLAAMRKCTISSGDSFTDEISGEEIAPDALVSMGFWGFPRSILPALRKYFSDFIQDSANIPENECDLFDAADWILQSGLLRIRAIKAPGECFTAQTSDPETIPELIAEGVYPPSLWS